MCCLFFFNGDLSRLERVAAAGSNRAAAVGDAFLLLHKHLICVEEEPIVSRFFLFTNCIFKLLLMKLFRLPQETFQLVHTRPNEGNETRLNRFWTYFSSDRASKELRVVSVSLRLTMLATSITAQKPKPGTEREPTIVRSAKAEVQIRTSKELQDILGCLHLDPELDMTDSVSSLFTTMGHICIRFRVYLQYPSALWKICRRFNADGYLTGIEEFLYAREEELDLGYSFDLQRDALSTGFFATAIAFLMCKAVQEEVEGVFEHGHATALDVERENNLDKRPEGRKGTWISSVGRCSRNSILQCYRAERVLAIARVADAREHADKLKFTSLSSLAMKRNPGFFPRARGGLHWEVGVIGSMARASATLGDLAALRAHIAEHRDELRQEAKHIRDQAMAKLHSIEHPVPYSNAEWLKWFSDNEIAFKGLLRNATATRRSLSHQLDVEQPLPTAPRVQPQGRWSQRR